MEQKTVFVIGAGASKEANLPTGKELKGEISDLLNLDFHLGRQVVGDFIIGNALVILVTKSEDANRDSGLYLNAARHIRDALPQAISIDNFIDTHRDNEKIAVCGKLAIVRSILSAEKNSLLYLDPSKQSRNFDYQYLENTWYLPFFQLITENCEKKNLKERFKSITLIIFNYDRCVEHYLYHALQNYYGITKDDAAELVKSINIYHPYGRVGLLPWWGQSDQISFGAEPNPDQLLALVNQIKTFTEGTDPKSSEIMAIKDHMGRADRLVFLGFAFHKLNMQLITPDRELNNAAIQCYATTKGISESDQGVISEQIAELYPHRVMNILMKILTCKEFFVEFWRSLSF